MLKMTIDNEEVLSNNDISIKEEILSPSSTILNNVYPKSWEQDKDYVSRFYYPKDYSKLNIQNFSVEPEEVGTTIQVNGNVTLNDVDTTKESRVLRLLGQTSQNGTPTPSSPIPINVVSGDNEINICGKNLFDFSSTPTLTSSTTYSFTNDTLQVSSTTGGYKRAEWDILDFIKNKPSKVLKFFYASRTDTAGTGNVQMRIKNNGTNTYIQMYTNSYTIPSDTSGITEAVLQVYSNNSNTSQANTLTITNPIIQFGTTQGTYEPYKGKTYDINLGNIELCKIGTYQDYIYKDNGSWYLHKEIGKVVLNGSEDWQIRADVVQTGYTCFRNGSYVINSRYTDSNITNVYCNYFVVLAQYTGQPMIRIINATEYGETIMFPSNIASTEANFKAWLSNHNTILYYVLRTPTNTEITDTLLLSQLNDLES